MLKRILACVVICLLFIPTLVFPLTVSADVIWNNSFLDKVRDKTVVLNRNTFVVDSKSGTLSGKVKPESNTDDTGGNYSHAYKNGETLYLNKVYKHNGEYWGISDYSGHGGPSGWFPMNQLLVMYDSRDFTADANNEFYTYTGNFNIKNVADKLVTWQWPGSDYSKTIYNLTGGEDWGDIDIKNIKTHYAYKDTQGREWGYVEIEAEITISIGHGNTGRSMNAWDTWICFSDPSNENIPAFHPAPAPKKWSPSTGATDSNPVIINKPPSQNGFTSPSPDNATPISSIASKPSLYESELPVSSDEFEPSSSNVSETSSADIAGSTDGRLFYVIITISSILVLLTAGVFVYIKVFRKLPEKAEEKSEENEEL